MCQVNTIPKHYDISEIKKQSAIQNLKMIYGDGERYFIEKKLISEKFDIILFSNLLHEINPNNWKDEFDYIEKNLLNENGFILLLENTEMKTGENAHEYGFLVLETESLRLLFGVDSDSNDIIVFSERMKDKYDIPNELLERVQAHIIKKNILSNISDSSIQQSLTKIKERAGLYIKQIKKEEKSRKNGKRLGFYTQQYVSADMFLNKKANY